MHFDCFRRLTRSGKLFLFGNHCLDAVVHILNEVNLGAAESSLVRDVVHVVGRLRVLAVDASDLDVVLVSNGLEFVHLDTKLGQFDVDRGSQGCAQVSWA